MSKNNTTETDFLSAAFNAICPTWMGTGITGTAFTGGITNVYVALHTASTASMGESSSQTTSETVYAGYARVGVVRTSAGWTVSSPGGIGTVVNLSAINFPQCTGTSAQIISASVGTLTSGAGQILYLGDLSGGGLAVTNGVTPSFAAGNLSITED
jgi:hypothetical protein